MFEQCIVIPSYEPNEALIRIATELSDLFETIIIVDDGSSVEYGAVYIKIEAIRNCVLLRHQVNQGKGRALKTAFNYYLQKQYRNGVITVDADGQHKVTDVIKIADRMRTCNSSLVLGCRDFSKDSVPTRSKFGNNISKYVYKWLCGIEISDTQTGLRGIPDDFVSIACSVSGERYEYETNMLLTAYNKGVKFSEVEIETVYEGKNEVSHFRPVKDSVRIYSVVLKYSLSSIVAAAIDYIVFGLLTRVGIPILCATYLSRVCSAIANFSINRHLVFKSKNNLWKELLLYISLLVVSGTVSGLFVSHMVNRVAMNKILAKVCIETLLYLANFYIQRTIVFRKR